MHKKAGFTIVEVIVATIILIISLLGGVVFFSLNRNNLAYANLQRLATWCAVYKIEQLKSADYHNTILNAGTYSESNLPISGYFFTRTTTITDISGNYKQVDVSVSWVRGNLPSSLTTLSLTTYISDRL